MIFSLSQRYTFHVHWNKYFLALGRQKVESHGFLMVDIYLLFIRICYWTKLEYSFPEEHKQATEYKFGYRKIESLTDAALQYLKDDCIDNENYEMAILVKKEKERRSS